MSALRELLARFSIEVDDKELKEGEKGISGFVEKLKHAGEAFATAFAVEKIKSFVEEQIKAGAALKATSERLGTDTDELQAMHLAAEKAGVGAETLDTSLRFLNRSIAEASKQGSAQSKTFKELGISLKNTDGSTKTSSELMGEFADAVANIHEPAKQTQVAMQLLGRGGAQLIPLLKEGGEAFVTARKQLIEFGGGMSKDFVEAAHKAEAANALLELAMTSLKTKIATAILPTFEKLIAVGTRLVANASDMAKHTGVITTAMVALGVAAAVVAPVITAIAVGGSILYLAFDELYTLLKGGDTVIGDALGPNKQKFVQDLSKAVDKLAKFFDDMNEAVGNADTGMGAFATTVVTVAKAMAAIVEAIAWLISNAEKFGKIFGNLALGDFKRAGVVAQDVGSSDNFNENVYDQEADEKARQDQKSETAELHLQATGKNLRERTRAIREQKEYDAGGFTGPPAAIPTEGSLLRAAPPPGYLLRPNMVEVSPGSQMGADGASGKGPLTVQQTNTFNTELHVQPGANPTEVAGAVNSAVATPVQRASERAYTAGNPR